MEPLIVPEDLTRGCHSLKPEIAQWCDDSLSGGYKVEGVRLMYTPFHYEPEALLIWFENPEDMLLFKMRFGARELDTTTLPL